MTTDTNTSAVPPSIPSTPEPHVPVNPARGSLQGQTTQAAKLDRWEALVNNLLPHLEQLPGLTDSFALFQGMVASVKILRNRLKVMRADTGNLLAQRNQIFVDGDDLYARLSLVLQGVHGPQNDRLREFGLKPRKKSGLGKTPLPSLVPAIELTASPVPEKPPAK